MNFPSFSSHTVVDAPVSQSFPPQNLTMVMLIIISRNPYLLWIFLLSPNFHLLHGCWVNWDLLLRRLILYSSYIRTLIGWKSLRLLLELGSLCSRMHENGHADTGATCRHVAKSEKCIETTMTQCPTWHMLAVTCTHFIYPNLLCPWYPCPFMFDFINV